ncbi:hypothetical protein R1sor_010195 [Riccia sorocarpa]|uniref:Pre-mRNA-processing protein 40A n=1 Tax=Riccia sorocarpa TaxID=122646 RepID=A0ABD3I0P1_9MARC
MPGLGPSGAPPNFGVPPMQFRPQGPPQPGQPFIPPGGQQYRPGVPPPGMGPPQHGVPPNIQGMGPQQGIPPSSQPSQYPPSSMQQMLPRPPQQPQPPQASQGPPMSYSQQPRPGPGIPPQQQPQSHGMPLPPGAAAPGMQPPSSFGFNSSVPYPQAPMTYGMTQSPYPNPMQPQPMQAMQPSGQPWSMVPGQGVVPAAPQGLAPAQPSPAGASPLPGGANLSAQSSLPGASDWQEHTAPDGRRYYHNKRTKLSSWEKPVELMTPTERADASTVWKEFVTAEGRKYYYNKITKQSKWTMPDEMKLAREQADKSAAAGTAGVSAAEGAGPSITAGTTASGNITASVLAPAASPKPGAVLNPTPAFLSPLVASSVSPSVTAVPAFSPAAGGNIPSLKGVLTEVGKDEKPAGSRKEEAEEASAQDLEEAKKAMPLTGKINVTPVVDEKPSAVAEEPLTYASKAEAKNAFKELLESVHVESDWTWDQAMRVIINDKRYGALKTLGERKQAFNEYLAQRKKLESEEKRLKQKKAREDFLAMLEESKELTSSMRWSKALTLFEGDPRFHAVDKDREREELYEDYLVDLERKEREKAREERKKNLAEYRAFLESCDFIKANTQWRKVQDKLEDDERCSRLDKIDRLEGFQEYIRELEKEEEEEKKLQKEQLRRKERKNRDEFRSLMEEHKAAGILTARTQWRDYLVKVKDQQEYQAVAANTSGSTPKELFEDFAEELDKQYHEDKVKAKEAIKIGKISVTTTWTWDKFKAAIAEAGDLEAIAEPNLKLVFEDLIERAKEKDEKEAKKKRRVVDDFTEVLRAMKQVTVSSKWEECRPLLEDTAEFRAFSEESAAKKAFEDYITHLQQRVKEKDRKREKEEKGILGTEELATDIFIFLLDGLSCNLGIALEAKKDKDKDKDKERERRKDKDKDKDKDKERDKDKEKSKREKETVHDGSETTNSNVHKEEKKRDKEREKDKDREKDKKHKKRHRSSSEDAGSDREDKDREDSKRSRKHGTDHKKSSRKHGHESGSDSEARHKRHRRDRDGTRRNGAAEELEDGELGEDGEIR